MLMLEGSLASFPQRVSHAVPTPFPPPPTQMQGLCRGVSVKLTGAAAVGEWQPSAYGPPDGVHLIRADCGSLRTWPTAGQWGGSSAQSLCPCVCQLMRPGCRSAAPSVRRNDGLPRLPCAARLRLTKIGHAILMRDTGGDDSQAGRMSAGC